MTIDLVFITYNRLDYTKLALASVLADPREDFSLTIWDNASTDGRSLCVLLMAKQVFLWHNEMSRV